LQEDHVVWDALGPGLKTHDEQFDVVWLRRPKKPVLSSVLHPDDKENALRGNLAFFSTFWHVITPDSQWINPPVAANAAQCKLLQLKVAIQVGLKVPKTIISNDPIKIRDFIRSNENKGVIYKAPNMVSWLSDKEKPRATYTNKVTLGDLPDDTILQVSGGIFQKNITKAFELRVTMMGANPITAKLDSQNHPMGTTDWRSIPNDELSVEEFELPSEIKEKCIAFMKKMGLLFGCFDFIVTPDGEYYFLEINEQGQFLWVEDRNPSIKMLDSFVKFLLDPLGIHKQGESSYPIISLKEFSKEVQKRMAVN